MPCYRSSTYLSRCLNGAWTCTPPRISRRAWLVTLAVLHVSRLMSTRSQILVPAQDCLLKAVRWHAAASPSATVCANMRGACCRAPRQKSGRRRRTSMQPGCGSYKGMRQSPGTARAFTNSIDSNGNHRSSSGRKAHSPGTSRSSATYRPIRFIRQPGASPPRSSTIQVHYVVVALCRRIMPRARHRAACPTSSTLTILVYDGCWRQQ